MEVDYNIFWVSDLKALVKDPGLWKADTVRLQRSHNANTQKSIKEGEQFDPEKLDFSDNLMVTEGIYQGKLLLFICVFLITLESFPRLNIHPFSMKWCEPSRGSRTEAIV